MKRFTLFLLACSLLSLSVGAQNTKNFKSQLKAVLNASITEIKGDLISDEEDYTLHKSKLKLDPFEQITIYNYDGDEFMGELIITSGNQQKANEFYEKLSALIEEAGSLEGNEAGGKTQQQPTNDWSRYTRFYKGNQRIVDLVGSQTEGKSGEYKFSIKIFK